MRVLNKLKLIKIIFSIYEYVQMYLYIIISNLLYYTRIRRYFSRYLRII